MNDENQSWAQPGSSQIDYEIVLDDMLKCFIRYWWQILVLLSAVCSIAYGAARAVYRPVYVSSSTFIVSSLNSAGHDRNQYNSAVTSQLGSVFPYLLSSDILTKLVAEDMGTKSIPGRVSSEALKGTSLITLKAEASNAKLSYDILQSVIKNYPEVSSYVIGDIELKLMDESGIPERPSNPMRARYYAGLAGLGTGGVVALLLFLYAITRMTVRSEKDLKVLFNVPALGSVPSVRLKKRSQITEIRVAVDEKNIPYFFIESFRAIRNRVEKEMSENGFQTILVTSALPSEGKSTVAANLALSLAHKDRKVILVDLDLRNPSLGKILQVEKCDKGIGEVLSGNEKMGDILISYPKNSNLMLLPGHGSLNNPAELLNTDLFRALLEEMKQMADYVILDTPPSAVVSDASVIAKNVDACMYVVRQDHAKLDSLQEGMEMLAGTGAAVIGTVLNGIESSVFSGGYGYGYYQYGRYGYYGHYGRYGYTRRSGYYGYQGYQGYQGYGEKRDRSSDAKEQQISGEQEEKKEP